MVTLLSNVRYDLPVPALPVKNTLFPALMAFITALCSGIRFIWKELKDLRRLLSGPLCSSFPQFESLFLPVVLIRFGDTPFLSSRGLFLRSTVKSLSVRGLMFSYDRTEQLQNTPQLIYMSLNKNSVYCVMPRSSKPPDTCKWGGNELRGILKFSRPHFITEKPSSVTCNSILFTLSKFQWQTF